MRKIVCEFFHRGLVASGFGPIVLAVLYLILEYHGEVQMLTVHEVSSGILSLSALAFLAGGMNVVYQIERLPLMLAILIHGSVLYISYLGTYLLNNWLVFDTTHVIVFSAIFVLGYLMIWIIIYCVTKKRTQRLNEILKKKQQM